VPVLAALTEGVGINAAPL
jgi:hypothetical protein